MSLLKDVRDMLYDEIRRRPYTAGEKIPGTRELAEQYKVSYVTMSNVLNMFAEEGVIRQYPGKGSFVTELISKNSLALLAPDYLLGVKAFNPETDSTCLFGLMDVYAGLLAAVEKNGFNLHVIPVNHENLNIDAILSMLTEKLKISAACFLAIGSEKLIERFESMNFPYCVVHTPAGSPFNHVAVDLEKGAYMAVNHLAELGHRRIALISGMKDSTWFEGRYAGYCAALEKHKIEYDSKLVKESSMAKISVSVLGKLVDALLKLPQPPTAILVTSDRWALCVMDILKERGIKIPDNISVVGFDDFVASKVYDPPLTTVRQPFYELGMEAFSLLKDLLRDGKTQGRKTIDPFLVMRKSTARLNKKNRK
ncbi:MAG: hypothetical protein A2017_14040 [Lentisphaerae bacterium GWF2_44_16]|nr:MAG: hypothetical protein A2017_14040 [Lentisphaerae bacterium GWF2_44_16]